MIIKRDKEFSLVGDIYHSGAKRAYKKYVGRTRRTLAKKINKSASKDLLKGVEEGGKMLDSSKVENKPIREELYREAGKNSARVHKIDIDGQRGSYIFSSSSLKKRSATGQNFKKVEIDTLEGKKTIKNSNRRVKGLNKSLKLGRHDYQIFNTNGKEELAHEIGHAMNSKTKNLKKRLTNALANSTDVRKTLNNDVKDMINYGGVKRSGLGSTIGTLIRNKIIESEEKNASKNAIKLLKEKGASKDEISKAKDNLKHGLNSYKYTGRAALKSNIAQTVEIPSRRVKRK